MNFSLKLWIKPSAVAFLGAALFVSSVTMNASSAQAGFEWRPPQDIMPIKSDDNVVINDRAYLNTGPIAVNRSPLPDFVEPDMSRVIVSRPSAPQAPVVAPVTSAPSVQNITPRDTIVIEGNKDGSPLDLRAFSQGNSKQAHQFNTVPSGVVDETSTMPVKRALPAPRSFSEKSTQESGLYKTAEGFGRDLPFVIAARQIVPENYEFDMQQGVDVSTIVSWQGGRPWRDVLTETASTAGLDFEVKGGVVSVFEKNNAEETVFTQTIDDMRSEIDAQLDNDVVLTAADRQEPEMVVDAPEVAASVAVAPIFEDDLTKSDIAEPLARVRRAKKETVPVQELPSVAFASPRATVTNQSVWFGARDSSLRAVLKDWSTRANVELYWDSEFDYPIRTNVVVEGDFETAVRKLLEGFGEAQPRPLGRLHKNSEQGPSVLIVEANDLID